MLQQSQSDAQFQRPPCVSGPRALIQDKIVRADAGTNDDGLAVFLSARGRLFGIAYRILKSAAEAEDIVQDVWIRWQTTDRSVVEDPAAFLSTTTRRLAINVIHSARSRQETSVQPPLEPADPNCDPASEAEQNEGLQSAVFILMERLSPAELAAYVLREAFDYSYREIAKILRLEEANSRQLVTRARQHVADGQHAIVNSAEQKHFLAAFRAAAQEGALAVLESFFAGTILGSIGINKPAVRTGHGRHKVIAMQDVRRSLGMAFRRRTAATHPDRGGETSSRIWSLLAKPERLAASGGA